MGCDRGKEEKFKELYQQYRKDVYRISLYYTKNEQESQDIVQRAFFAFYLRMDHIEWDCAYDYLKRTARNMSYNWLRDMKKEREGEDAEVALTDKLVDSSAEEVFFSRNAELEQQELLAELMRELYIANEIWYEIINLIYCLEMSYDDAARVLGMPKSVLYSRARRAKQWIEKRYREKNKERL